MRKRILDRSRRAGSPGTDHDGGLGGSRDAGGREGHDRCPVDHPGPHRRHRYLRRTGAGGVLVAMGGKEGLAQHERRVEKIGPRVRDEQADRFPLARDWARRRRHWPDQRHILPLAGL